jgi:hypothetical protein
MKSRKQFSLQISLQAGKARANTARSPSRDLFRPGNRRRRHGLRHRDHGLPGGADDRPGAVVAASARQGGRATITERPRPPEGRAGNARLPASLTFRLGVVVLTDSPAFGWKGPALDWEAGEPARQASGGIVTDRARTEGRVVGAASRDGLLSRRRLACRPQCAIPRILRALHDELVDSLSVPPPEQQLRQCR